jgi:hypothetical protein
VAELNFEIAPFFVNTPWMKTTQELATFVLQKTHDAHPYKN